MNFNLFKKISVLTFLFFPIFIFAQENIAKKDSTKKLKSILEYKVFNSYLGGDSVRMCHNNPCLGRIRDYYENGELKHEGYYEDGKLTTKYQNYFDNGQKERVFQKKNSRKAKMKVFYRNGQKRSKVTYWKGQPLERTEYTITGEKKYYMLYDKSLEYLKEQTYFHKNGNVRSHMEIIEEQDKHLYSKKIYYPKGQLKAKGKVLLNVYINAYRREGDWIFYDKKGNPQNKKIYVKGKVVEENSLE